MEYDDLWDDLIVEVEIMNVVTGEIHDVIVAMDDYPDFLKSFREQSYGFKLV